MTTVWILFAYFAKPPPPGISNAGEFMGVYTDSESCEIARKYVKINVAGAEMRCVEVPIGTFRKER